MAENQTTQSEPHGGCLYCDAVKPFFRSLWSDATRSHFRNSRVEFLKGVRSVIDDRIDRLSKQQQKGEHVVVE